MTRPPLKLFLAAPRGFCAGVDRAIKIVEMAIEKWGVPVYVRHEIVHNRHVVDELRAKGAIFVEELEECPPDRPVIFSAHGVPKSVPAAAEAREMVWVDATCPLVSKVHIEAARHAEAGLQMVMIGHAGHPETVGTMGQLPPGEVLLVETAEDVDRLQVRDEDRLAFVTQTTLSVDDTADVVAALKARFPGIVGPHKEDICYATTNRQEAVKAMAPHVDAMLVVGAPNSSNSRRLVEVGARAGCGYAQLVQGAHEIDWRALDGIGAIGISAGASAPEVLIDGVIEAFRARYDVTIEEIVTAVETVEFKVPRVLRETERGLAVAGDPVAVVVEAIVVRSDDAQRTDNVVRAVASAACAIHVAHPCGHADPDVARVAGLCLGSGGELQRKEGCGAAAD